MPQSQATGEMGKRLIRQALLRENVFADRKISITAVPTSNNSIRFDVHIEDNSVDPITISVTQEI
jgi:hypothetical protein